MQQSVIYQEWKEEFLQQGEQTGALREAQLLILRLLDRRIGDVPSEARSQIQTLSLEQLEALGEALLDFSKSADLANWLQDNQVG